MTFDIDKAISERFSKGGNPYREEKRGRMDYEDPENVFQFMENMFGGNYDYGNDEGYLKLRSLLNENPELAHSLMAAIEQSWKGRDPGGYRMIPGKYQGPEEAMNRIGADKPRQGFWEKETFTVPEPDGEGGYTSRESSEYFDATGDKPGLTARARAAKDNLGYEGDDAPGKGPLIALRPVSDIDSAIAANQPTGRASPEPVRSNKGPGQRP